MEYVPRLVPDISSAVSLEELYKSVLQAAEQHEAGQPAPTSEKEHSFGATPVEPLSSIIRGINNTLESIELLRVCDHQLVRYSNFFVVVLGPNFEVSSKTS